MLFRSAWEGGHRKLAERTRITWQHVPSPPSVPGRGRGRVEGRPGRKREPGGSESGQAGWLGRRRALALALLRPQPRRARSLLLPLLLLLRRRLLGAVCSGQLGSRSPRNAHTLNRYIVDIRR